MANQNTRAGANRGGAPSPIPGVTDAAPRSGIRSDFDIPNEDGLHGETTPSFGSIRTITLKALTPLEEKDAAAAAGGDGVQLAYELARRSICEVTNEHNQQIAVYDHDGTQLELWAQMHPKIRSLAMQAYADVAVPPQSATRAFLKSRRIRA